MSEALRYDTDKPQLLHIHPHAWRRWLDAQKAPGHLYSINYFVDDFFYFAAPCLPDAWRYVSDQDLIDMSRVLEFGATKYEPYNWLKGMAWSRVFNSFRRHTLAIVKGEDIDPESGISHMGHVACNLMFLQVYYDKSLGTDDRRKI